MKLIDRVKQPYLDKLKSANIKYPAVVGLVFDELEEKEFWTKLSVLTWLDIQSFTGATHPADVFTHNL